MFPAGCWRVCFLISFLLAWLPTSLLISNCAAKERVSPRIVKGSMFTSTGVSDWLIFDPLAEGGVEVDGSLTCPAGIIAACLGEVWGDGHEENTFCHTLIHNLHLSLCVKAVHTVVIHISSSLFCLCLSGCVSRSPIHTHTHILNCIPCSKGLSAVCAFKQVLRPVWL